MTRPDVPTGPAWLFVPGDRPDRWAKAAAAADCVIIDLEDAVAPGERAAARGAVRDSIGIVPVDRLVVRINGPDDPDHDADIRLLDSLDVRTVLVPKVGSADDLQAVGARLPGRGLIALCERACAIVDAARIAAVENCVGLFLGSEDLSSDLGAISSRDARTQRQHRFIEHARTDVRFAAAAREIVAIDTPTVLLDRSDLLCEEAAEAAAMGFYAKACIHPAQVTHVRAAFRPDEASINWARTVVAAAADAGGQAADHGVIIVGGMMVDAPVIALASSILDRARD